MIFSLAYRNFVSICCSVVELQSCDLFVFIMDARRIEVNLSQDKIKSINSAFQKELDYWKEAALENLDENEANQLKVLAPPSLLLIRKAEKNAKKVDINKIIAYLKSQYSTNNRNQIALVQNFPSLEEVSSFDGIQEELKNNFKTYQG